MNAVISEAAAHQDAVYVDTRAPFKGDDGTKDCTELLASDGDHPNRAGHRTIATAILQALS